MTELPEPELRPEEPRRRPSTPGGVVYLVVALTTAAGFLAVALDSWRAGLTVMGCAMLAGSVARLVLADENAGMLKVRRKSLDVLSMALLGAALVTLAIVVPNTPAV